MGDAHYIQYTGQYATDLCPAGDVDYFTVDHFRDGPFTLTVTGGSLNVDLLDQGGSTVASGTSISQSNLSRGSYYIKVASPTGSKVDYTLDVTKEDYAHGRPFSMP